MKASESVKNYPSERRMYANYVARNVKKVCKEIGPRSSGTEKELEALEWLSRDLKETCDDVKIEEFTISPWAFMGWVKIASTVMLLSSILLLVSHFFAFLALPFAIASCVAICISLFLIVTEFLFYGEVLDPFYKKSQSHNLVGVRKASGETKRRIIYSGHVDSAPEWHYTYWGGGKLLTTAIIVSFIGVALIFANSIASIVFAVKNGEPPMALYIVQIVSVCFAPIYIVNIFKFYNRDCIVEGANDNLTGCLCAMSVARFLQDQNIRFENTEVVVVCTGSEEAGLRGAKAFARDHKDMLNDGIETVFFGLDTIRDFDDMAIYSKDMTGTVTNSPEVSALVKAGAAIAGYDLPYSCVFFGSSDAAAMTKGGFKATCLAAMDPTPARYYHTRLDTADNLDLKTIEAGVDICLETAFLFDEKGLDVEA